jgi:hypothetical protein
MRFLANENFPGEAVTALEACRHPLETKARGTDFAHSRAEFAGAQYAAPPRRMKALFPDAGPGDSGRRSWGVAGLY